MRESDDREEVRAYVRSLLQGERKTETAEAYERMLYRMHTYLAPDEPFDMPEAWLGDLAAVGHHLSTYSRSSQLKHLSVIIEMLRAAGGTQCEALLAKYLAVRSALAEAATEDR